MQKNHINSWPKAPTYWMDGTILCVSIPFTWSLPSVRAEITQTRLFNAFDFVLVGGPAVELMPDYFNDIPYVRVGHEMPGVLQRINPLATRTTTGCPNRCGFCAIGTGKVEGGGLVELSDWPDLPIICDNNLLASSIEHFNRVIDRLVRWEWADFNQGLDARLLNEHHAARFSEIRKPKIRLSLDHSAYRNEWQNAYSLLRSAGIAKNNIKSYALIGFNSDPHEAWERCQWIESHGIEVYPMWFHALDQMEETLLPTTTARGGGPKKTAKESWDTTTNTGDLQCAERDRRRDIGGENDTEIR